MRKVIGIASEGPTDFQVLKTAINTITGEDNIFRALQPEQNMIGQYGNGWKGVWRWCKEAPPLDILMDGIQPQLDLIVIQMDGDVVRKEKEVHCLCKATECDEKGKSFPLYCERTKLGCPILIPCKNHEENPKGNREHGIRVIRDALGNEWSPRVLITIPCDSTDAWVVAAYDQLDNIEYIEDLWRNVIARSKYYHNVRVRGDKKNTRTYECFMQKVADNWDVVTQKCESAKLFELCIKRLLLKE